MVQSHLDHRLKESSDAVFKRNNRLTEKEQAFENQKERIEAERTETGGEHALIERRVAEDERSGGAGEQKVQEMTSQRGAWLQDGQIV